MRAQTWVLVVMCAGMFLVLLDVTVVNVALPSIGHSLGAGTAGVQWVVDSYAVAIAGALLAAGAAGDRFGHRRLVLAGLVVFGLASLGCGLAPSAGWLVAARAVQGLGAAVLLPGSMAVIVAAFPRPAEQARALGVWAAVSSLALPAGPLLGGFAVSWLGWRSVFLVNPPVVAAALAGVLLVVPRAAGDRSRRLDVPGVLSAALALTAAVYAVIAGAESGVRALVSGGVAVLAAAGFVLRERRAADPVLPPALFRQPMFCGATVTAFGMNFCTNGSLFVLTLYLQRVLGFSAAVAGLLLLPLFSPLAVLSPLAGRLTARFGPRPPMLLGAVFAGLGELALLLVPGGYPVLLPAMLGIGVGVGLFTAPVVTAAIRAVPAGRSGVAGGVSNTARQAGTALGVAVFGAVVAATPDFAGGLRLMGAAAGVVWLGSLVLTAVTIRQPPAATKTGPDMPVSDVTAA